MATSIYVVTYDFQYYDMFSHCRVGQSKNLHGARKLVEENVQQLKKGRDREELHYADWEIARFTSGPKGIGVRTKTLSYVKGEIQEGEWQDD